MAKFCTYCGSALEPDSTVCKECGVETNVSEKAEPVSQPTPTVAPVTEIKESNEESAPTGKYAVASTSSFFWFSLLYSLPIIGFICSIIFSFASKNYNSRNYARSILVWYLLGVIAVLLVIVLLIALSLIFGVTLADLIYDLRYM